MCGIVGIAGKQETSWLSQMNELERHRGPDEAGEYRDEDPGVSLAMRRLSILDIASGHQPMSNADGSLWIVYNGEVYNSPELRARLERAGCEFRTNNSDTEVVLRLYEREGANMLRHLNGMFAFVIYDRNQRKLFGARDRFGIKPLYYFQTPDLFAFASEIKSFLVLPSFERDLDLSSLYHYMSMLHIPGANSIFSQAKRLLPAHYFEYDLDRKELSTQQYWDLDFNHPQEHSEEEWKEIIRVELSKAVQRWTLSDVPVGCSLSGGIDSSAIVSLLGEAGHPKIKTYALGFAGPGEEEWNELPLARQVAERWGTEHHELVLEPEVLLDDLVQMVWHLDEPYGGGLPSWYVFRFMSESVKVGMTGTGGDEVFGNYGKYRVMENSQFAQAVLSRRSTYENFARSFAWAWRPCYQLAEAVPETWLGSYRKRRLAGLFDFGGGPIGRYFFNPWYYFSDGAKRAAVFQMDLEGISDTGLMLQRLYDTANTSDLRNSLTYLDFKTQLTDEFLAMTDRLSMAHSLEARVPFLDHEFVETVFNIPSALRMKSDDLKYLLKGAISDLLPEALLQAPKKGFVIPIKLWLRTSLRKLAEHLLSPIRLKEQKLFDPAFYGRYVKPHLDGRADFTWQVWSALMFQLWHLIFIEQKARTVPAFTWRDIVS